jgi:CHRD domain
VRRRIVLLTMAIVGTVTVVFANSGFRDLRAILSGFQEVPTLSSEGKARFQARINRQESAVDWRLSYDDLEGPITQAHIHFGARATNGPIVVFLCTNAGNGPMGTQACPQPPATISGTFMAADVLDGAAGLGLEAGNLEELIAALRAGATYANVHSQLRPAGEVRGQIGVHHDRNERKRD